jgi:hypothetical protein
MPPGEEEEDAAKPVAERRVDIAGTRQDFRAACDAHAVVNSQNRHFNQTLKCKP